MSDAPQHPEQSPDDQEPKKPGAASRAADRATGAALNRAGDRLTDSAKKRATSAAAKAASSGAKVASAAGKAGKAAAAGSKAANLTGGVVEKGARQVTDRLAGAAKKRVDTSTAKGQKKADAADMASDVVSSAAAGAATGAKAGAHVGAAVGAAGGALKGLAQSKAGRRKLLLPLILVLALICGPSLIFGGSILAAGTAIGAVLGAQSNSSQSSAVSHGAQVDEIENAKQLSEQLTGEVPWTIILSISKEAGPAKQGDAKPDDTKKDPTPSPSETPAPDAKPDPDQELGIDVAKVLAKLGEIDPGRSHRSLLAGTASYSTTTNQMLAVSSDQAAKSEQAATEQVYLVALQAGGFSKEQAKTVYERALAWELGIIKACRPDSIDSGDDSGQGNGTSGDGDWLKPGSNAYKVAKQIFTILTKDYGLSGAFAAGVLGNVKQESGFVPDRSQGPGMLRFGMNSKEPSQNVGGGGGLFQFTPYTKFTRSDYWGKLKPEGWAPENQIAFLWSSEFQHREVWGYAERNAPGKFKSLEDWLSTDDPKAAAEVFQMAYERPAAFHPERAEYAADANRVFNAAKVPADKAKWKLDGKGDTTTPGGGSSSGGSDSECGDGIVTDGGGLKVSGKWVSPLGKPTVWTSYEDIGTPKSHSAGAMDIPMPSGTPVYAATGGKVLRAGWEEGGGGNTVIIQDAMGHGIGAHHLSKITVSEGSTVKVGQKIGEVGSTGAASGPHLHFEVRQFGVKWGPWLRAFQFMKANGVNMGPCGSTPPECKLSTG